MAAASRKQHLLGKRQSLSTEEVLVKKQKLVQKVMTFMISKCEKNLFTLHSPRVQGRSSGFVFLQRRRWRTLGWQLAMQVNRLLLKFKALRI